MNIRSPPPRPCRTVMYVTRQTEFVNVPVTNAEASSRPVSGGDQVGGRPVSGGGQVGSRPVSGGQVGGRPVSEGSQVGGRHAAESKRCLVSIDISGNPSCTADIAT
jgi:hypothetical protein